jgi:hypothetical protein
VDLTHWFCWITAAGAVFGLLAAVQQLLTHGLLPFVRAVCVTAVIGLAVALVYPNIHVRNVGSGNQMALAVNAPAVGATTDGAAPPGPMTADSAPVLPLGTSLVEPMQVETAPAKPAMVEATPAGRTPIETGTVTRRRSEAVAFKPSPPALLPAQQKLFWPSEVAYCPICFRAYSSKGPTHDVKCPHCAAEVNLVSDPQYMVHRCGKCGALYRTMHFPPAVGPYLFRYYCSFCKEYHWYPN